MNLWIINLNSFGKGMSGGDRIWIELAKRWEDRANIALLGSHEASEKIELKAQFFVPCVPYADNSNLTKAFLLKNTLVRTFYGIKFVLSRRWDFTDDIIYSVSDFPPDSLTALLIKLTYRRVKWVAGYYLFAPNPWSKTNPYRHNDWWRGFFYWLIQRITYPLVKHFADIVFVTSEVDLKRFKKAIAIRGGVHIPKVYGRVEKAYDAVFIGRLHQNKGILELLKIWEIVVKARPEAKLAIIGNGAVKVELNPNIDLLGFLDGKPKWEVIDRSKVVVHPAIYENGGMACAEAMAFGLPAVGFNQPCYEFMYYNGMIKVKTINEFAEAICMLLDDKVLYNKYSLEARQLAEENFDWDKKEWDIWKRIAKHQHKCPDCGDIFICPCGMSCKVEYHKYPCIKCIHKHIIGFFTEEM